MFAMFNIFLVPLFPLYFVDLGITNDYTKLLHVGNLFKTYSSEVFFSIVSNMNYDNHMWLFPTNGIVNRFNKMLNKYIKNTSFVKMAQCKSRSKKDHHQNSLRRKQIFVAKKWKYSPPKILSDWDNFIFKFNGWKKVSRF